MKTRAVALLFVAFLFTGARQQSTAPEKLYADARLAFDRGEVEHALALGNDGRRRFGNDDKWNELFTIVVAESLGRAKTDEALAELGRMPRAGDPEAAVRLLMAYGYVLGDDAPLAKADALAVKVRPALRPEIAVRRAGPAMWHDDADAIERYSRQAIAAIHPMEQPFVYANARLMLGSSAMKRGDYQQAIERFDRVIRFAQTIGAKGPASIAAGNRAYAYLKLGDTEEALAGFEDALLGAKDVGNAAVQVTWLANIAYVFVATQQFDRALPYAEDAVAAAEKLGEKGRIAIALSNLAQVEIELKRYGDARRHNERALALYRRMKLDESTAILNSARIEAATGSTTVALQTLSGLTASSDLSVRWNAQAVIARIDRDQGLLREAERMYEAALDTGDSARTAVERQKNGAYLFAFEANLIRFYDEWIELLLDEGQIERALRVAERSRAHTLRRDQTASAPIEPTALARTHHATILSYWLAPARSLVWVITADGISVARLDGAAELSMKIGQYRDEIMRGHTGVDSARGAALFEELIAPALQAARAGRVIIIADGALNSINPESLVVSKPKPHFWIEDVTVSYAPSLRFLAPAHAGFSLRDAEVLIMGDVPSKGADFPHLARARSEMELVAQHFDSRRYRMLRGEEAKQSEYVKADLQRYGYLHFVAHGTANTHAPLESSVILADGRLTGHEIIKKPLSAELVTVSSCNSAGRRAYAGEGLIGLAWAFLDAGARRVVAAQWEIDDFSTPKLMNDMYKALGDGRDPATALREAKLAMVHGKGPYNRPLYWAPFILYGAP